MSGRIPLDRARDAAEALRDLLAPACERIELAGSIRRRRPEVKDIELVCIPRIDTGTATDIWGTPEPIDLLEGRLTALMMDAHARRDDAGLAIREVEMVRADGSIVRTHRAGPAYKALLWARMPVDLFVVRGTADWGVIFTIRTGPADWSQRLVTDCQRRFMRVEGGRLLHHGEHVPCPEEADFLAAIGQPWVDPWERTAERVSLSRPVTA